MTEPETLLAAKDVAYKAIDSAANKLYEVNQKLWNHPELAMRETYAHQLLTEELTAAGFSVQSNYHLETAFRADFERTSNSGPCVAVISEYDALPGIGHACGHNLIAEAGIAAGIGIKAALENGGINGKITVMGTPAEEAVGGKVSLLNAGAFADIEAAMMVHPFKVNTPTHPLIARTSLLVNYHGKASHAAGAPWKALNALDAAIAAYQSIACLRQQLRPEARVHCIVTDGGKVTNVIPESAQLGVAVRTPTKGMHDEVMAKVKLCLSGAAVATGCEVDIHPDGHAYEAMIDSEPLLRLYGHNVRQFGIEYCTDPGVVNVTSGSTDMGNVSQRVPSIHPMFAIGGFVADHTREFAELAQTAGAHEATIVQAKAMAATMIDVLYDADNVLPQLKAYHLTALAAQLTSG